MARFFFDIYANGNHTVDDTGTEFANLAEVRMAAMNTLPSVARDEIAKDGDRQAYTVLVTDDAGKPVYSATVGFAGLWLMRDGR